MELIEKQLTDLGEKQAAFLQKAQNDIDAHGRVATETKEALEAVRTQIQNLQKQTDAIDAKMTERLVPATAEEPLEETLKKSDSIQRMVKDRSGRSVITITGKQMARMLERKTTITSSAVGVSTTGVLQIDRIAGITAEARETLRVRDLLTARPTTMQVVDYVRVATKPIKASPQVEASDKWQNAVLFESKSEKVRTLATWIPATKQILEDFGELAGYLNTALPYYVNLDEESELLSGDSTGEHLNGLVTQATAFDTTLLHASAGWNKIDQVGRTIQQIRKSSEITPTFIVLHPNDWWDMRLTKDSYGRYILGDPQSAVRPSLFNLDVVDTTSMVSGTFLTGSGNSVAAEIRDRMEMQVEISTEHSDYFVKNLVAIRAEKRVALIVKRPASFITGTFNTSPA